MDGKVTVLDQDDANLEDLVGGLGEPKYDKPIMIEKLDSVTKGVNELTESPDNDQDEEKVVKTSFISTLADKEDSNSRQESDGINDIAIVDIPMGEINVPMSAGVEIKAEEHQLLNQWTFWYVYSMSHRDKKKVKQVRKNEYELREVYSFETVSAR